MPVIPGRSLTLPTRATHPPAMAGEWCRSIMSSFMPLESVRSWIGTCCAWPGIKPARAIARPSTWPSALQKDL